MLTGLSINVDERDVTSTASFPKILTVEYIENPIDCCMFILTSIKETPISVSSNTSYLLATTTFGALVYPDPPVISSTLIT